MTIFFAILNALIISPINYILFIYIIYTKKPPAKLVVLHFQA